MSAERIKTTDKKPDILFVLLAGLYWTVIAIALLDDGAVELVTVALSAIPLAGLLLVALFTYGIPQQSRRPLLGAIAIAAGAIGVVAGQTIALPGLSVSQPAWRELADLGLAGRGSISLSPADDWPSLLRLLSPIAIFLTGLILFDRDDRAVSALKLLAISGGIIACLSTLQFVLSPKTLLFAPKTSYLDSLTGFFVNRNTAGTYFGLISILNLGFLTHHIQALDWRRVLAAIDQRRRIPGEQRRVLLALSGYGLLLLLAVIALVLTKSRAGVGFTCVALLLLVITATFRPNYSRRGADAMTARPTAIYRKLLLAILVIVLSASLFLSFAGRALLRAEQQGTDDARFCAMPAIVSGIVDHLPFGTGLSSFQATFPGYRDPACGTAYTWNRAHNVYLETLWTLGAAGLILLLLTAVLILSVLAKGMRNRRSLRYVPEIGFAALLLVALHSAVDFSLQITGFAMVFAALLAPVIGICSRQPSTRRKRKSQNSSEAEAQTI